MPYRYEPLMQRYRYKLFGYSLVKMVGVTINMSLDWYMEGGFCKEEKARPL